jgi:hypothetical protein
MAGAAAPLSNASYLANLAEDHAAGRGYSFDEAGQEELLDVSESAVQKARNAGIYTVEDLMRDVAPNMIKLTDSIIDFADGVILRVTSIKRGLAKICPLFPFC